MTSKSTAVEFFDQLGTFSRRYLAEARIGNAITPWGGAWVGQPRGAIVHFTADEDLDRVLRWFLVEKYQAEAAAHVVVADRKLGSHSRLADGLPLVEGLSATVIQCRPPMLSSWHASWTNDFCYGIECLNAGELRTEDNSRFTSWRPKDSGSPDWTMPWSIPYK